MVVAAPDQLHVIARDAIVRVLHPEPEDVVPAPLQGVSQSENGALGAAMRVQELVHQENAHGLACNLGTATKRHRTIRRGHYRHAEEPEPQVSRTG